VSNGARVSAIESLGFTPRQARFLVLVLEHAGVCLPRQYRRFSGIAHGRDTHRFFAKLIAGGFALRLAENEAWLAQDEVSAARACTSARTSQTSRRRTWRHPRTRAASTTSSTSRGTGCWAAGSRQNGSVANTRQSEHTVSRHPRSVGRASRHPTALWNLRRR
jgi:hypothetical protein